MTLAKVKEQDGIMLAKVKEQDGMMLESSHFMSKKWVNLKQIATQSFLTVSGTEKCAL